MCCAYKVKIGEFEKTEIRRYAGRRPFLRENHFLEKKDGVCLFLGENRRCGIYPARPLQCRSYPFYPLEGQVDVDLSCPGVGRGTRMDPGWCEELRDQTLEVRASHVWTGIFETPDLGEDEFKSPGSALESQRVFNAVHEFLRIEGGGGTHLRKDRIELYQFSLTGDVVDVGGRRYCLGAVEPFSEIPALLSRYLRLWERRAIFRRFVSVCAPLCLARPQTLANAILRRLANLIPSLAAALWRHWDRAGSPEWAWEEAIRAVDGRLREKCVGVGIALAADSEEVDARRRAGSNPDEKQTSTI